MTLEDEVDDLAAKLMRSTVSPHEDEVDDLAVKLMRSAVSPHDATLIRGLMQAIAPFFMELQTQIAALEERVDDLER